MGMRYIRTVTCPLCGRTAERTRSDTEHYVGSPFRTCASCGKVYFDSKYEEPVIAIYTGSERFALPTFGRLFLGLVMTAYIIFQPPFGVLPIWGVILLILIGPGTLIHTIFFLVNSTKSKIIDKIENHPEKLTEEEQRSLERLSNQKYIDKLRSLNYYVPSFFDERIKKLVDKSRNI